MSGILQQGYSMGYVFAACANLGVGGATDSWKIVFWIAGKSALSVPDIICSSLTPCVFRSRYLDCRRSCSHLLPRVTVLH